MTMTNLPNKGYKKSFTAYIGQEDGWWVGWVQGVRGVNCQERTREELLDSIREVLPIMLELNKIPRYRDVHPGFEPVPVTIDLHEPTEAQAAFE